MSASESFLRRWWRLKREPRPSAATDTEPLESDVPPQLPTVETLDFDSDFTAFMHPKVDRDTRNAALKKLFASPHYQITDGLDVYVGDYSSPEPLQAAALAGLAHARAVLACEPEAEKSGEELDEIVDASAQPTDELPEVRSEPA